MRVGVLLGVLYGGHAKGLVAEHAPKPGCEGRGVAWGHQHTCIAALQHVGDPADGTCHHGAAPCLRLGDGAWARIRRGYWDWDYWLAALELGATFTHVDEELFCYRKHGTTMLSVADRHAMRLFATIAANHPSLFAPWRVRLAKRLLAAGEKASVWLRLGMLTTFLMDRRLRLFCRQLRALRATNMLST